MELQSILNTSHEGAYFTEATITPQGQLSLKLNRALVFAEVLRAVKEKGPEYGHCSSQPPSLDRSWESVFLVNHALLVRHRNTETTASGSGLERGCGPGDATGGDVSLSGGRNIFAVSVLANLLQAAGYKVHQHRCNMVNTCLQMYISFSLLLRTIPAKMFLQHFSSL